MPSDARGANEKVKDNRLPEGRKEQKLHRFPLFVRPTSFLVCTLVTEPSGSNDSLPVPSLLFSRAGQIQVFPFLGFKSPTVRKSGSRSRRFPEPLLQLHRISYLMISWSKVV